MLWLLCYLVALLALWSPGVDTEGCLGCVDMDKYNFDKLLYAFKGTLVKFDKSYPYGEQQDTFEKLTGMLAPNADILLAQVGADDYGVRKNEELGLRFNVPMSSYPALLYFHGSPNKHERFDVDTKWTVDSLLDFVTKAAEKDGITVRISGQIPELDNLAETFAYAIDKKNRIQLAQAERDKLTDEQDKKMAEYYIKTMKKIEEKGAGFIHHERERISKLLKDTKLAENKKTQFERHLSILRVFKYVKDEL